MRQAEVVGESERNLQRAMRRIDLIPKHVRSKIRGTVMAMKCVELDALAAIKDVKDQHAAVRLVLAGKAKSIRDATAAAPEEDTIEEDTTASSGTTTWPAGALPAKGRGTTKQVIRLRRPKPPSDRRTAQGRCRRRWE